MFYRKCISLFVVAYFFATITIGQISAQSSINANFSINNNCVGDSTQFTDLSVTSGGTITQWAWNFGDSSQVVHNQNVYHLYAVEGTYPVKLVVISNLGSTDSITKIITVNPRPVVDFTASDIAGCVPICASFNDLSTIATGINIFWSWDFGDGGPVYQAHDLLHCFTQAGFYDIKLTVTSDSGCAASLLKTQYLEVFSLPTADFTDSIFGGTVNFTNQSSMDVTSWFWDLGDPTVTTDTSHLQNPTYTYPTDVGVMACLIVTTQYGCPDTICRQIFSSSVNAITSGNFNAIYPNPSANGVFTVNVEGVFTKTIVAVENIIGEIVFSKEINLSGKHTIDLSNEPNGSYFVNIKNDKENYTKKITINK